MVRNSSICVDMLWSSVQEVKLYKKGIIFAKNQSVIRQIIWNYLGSAELIFSHRQRVADVAPHSDDNNENPPDFDQGKTKFP